MVKKLLNSADWISLEREDDWVFMSLESDFYLTAKNTYAEFLHYISTSDEENILKALSKFNLSEENSEVIKLLNAMTKCGLVIGSSEELAVELSELSSSDFEVIGLEVDEEFVEAYATIESTEKDDTIDI